MSDDKGAADVRLRRPTEADYPGIATSVDDWWDGKVLQGLLPRLWFRHFAGMSWIAEVDDERGRVRVVGFLVGYVSPADRTLGVIQAVGVDPSHRRSGIGRVLVTAFIEDARAAGVTAVETLLWPGNRRGLPFLVALGFEPEVGASTQQIYGVPATEGYDFGTEDRAIFRLRV